MIPTEHAAYTLNHTALVIGPYLSIMHSSHNGFQQLLTLYHLVPCIFHQHPLNVIVYPLHTATALAFSREIPPQINLACGSKKGMLAISNKFI